MPYIVLFEDQPGKEDLRTAHMAAHLDFLDAHADAFGAAGPLFGSEGPTGGLWLVEAETRADVEALVKADPFWPTGLRKSVEIREWRQVWRDGARRI